MKKTSTAPAMDSPLQSPPRHLAVIMDGNRRWAELRNLPPEKGWQQGEERLYELTRMAAQKGVSVLSAFAFSTENWRRDKQQIGQLMQQLNGAVRRRRKELIERGVQVLFIGARDRLSTTDRSAIEQLERDTRTPKPKLRLIIAFDYGGQWDLLSAVRRLTASVLEGQLAPEDIDASRLEQHTSLRGQPPVDLLVRTGGEQRISNFFLWQIAYAELYFTACLWPDFGERELESALAAYGGRQRRFGGTVNGR